MEGAEEGCHGISLVLVGALLQRTSAREGQQLLHVSGLTHLVLEVRGLWGLCTHVSTLPLPTVLLSQCDHWPIYVWQSVLCL